MARWLVVSLLVHLLGLMSWEGARRLAQSRPEVLPEWMKTALLPPKPPTPEEMALRPKPPEPEPDVEIPLSFLEVDPAQAVAQPPKDARFVSTANTLAGNPNPPVKEATTPRIEGKREDIPRVMDVVKATPQPPAPQPQSECTLLCLKIVVELVLWQFSWSTSGLCMIERFYCLFVYEY